jgi:hypothetical protein
MKPRLLTVCLCLLTIPGCAQNENKPVTPAIDLAPYRCPPARAADRAVFGEPPAPPPAGALTEAGAKQWVDRIELQVEARNRAGRRVIREYDACRGTPAPAR